MSGLAGAYGAAASAIRADAASVDAATASLGSAASSAAGKVKTLTDAQQAYLTMLARDYGVHTQDDSIDPGSPIHAEPVDKVPLYHDPDTGATPFIQTFQDWLSFPPAPTDPGTGGSGGGTP